jgi:acyl-CoA hydrolase
MPKQEREVTLRFFAEPKDVNFYGKVFGGAVMQWIDLAGYACAAAWCATACVTIYVGGIRFYKPILVGHLVEITAKLIHTGRSTMHIAVDVCSKDPKQGTYIKTTHCVIVFAAVDEKGNTISVPKWVPQTEEDHQLEAYALKLMALSKQVENELATHL